MEKALRYSTAPEVETKQFSKRVRRIAQTEKLGRRKEEGPT